MSFKKDVNMKSFKTPPASYWIESVEQKEYPVLNNDIKTDVLIIGGGMTGITAASILKEAGVKLVMLEARKILQGTTGNTTAKVTSQHHLIYHYLISKFGVEKAHQYAEANQSAIEFIAKRVTDLNIHCDFERKSAYVYTESDSFIKNIENETDSALKLGIPAEFVTESTLPFQIKCAVKFNNQAQFHPLKYLLKLLENIEGDDCHIYENTQALSIEGSSPYTVITDRGKVEANKVIVATHYPIFDKPGLYFARLYQSRSYIIGAKVTNTLPDGMFISADGPTHSFRTQPTDNGQMLLVAGEDHKTGQGDNTILHYERLKQYAERIYNIESIDYHWSAQDCMPVDSVPFIGKLSPNSENLYVATGFKKWGMTNSTVSAMLLSDLILERPNPWLDVFNPNRFNIAASAEEITSQNLNTAGKLVGGILNIPSDELETVFMGEGKIIKLNNKKLAIYRDHDNHLHAVSPYCTHLGCEIKWNDAEKTWDCPCHGSRYSIDGDVIEGPTVKNLERIEL